MTYDGFLKTVGRRFDLDWRKYRRRSARRNLDDRLRQLDLSGYAQYLDYLDNDPIEAERLPDLLRVTVSRFFREHECWRGLADVVLPELLSRLGTSEPLRAWSAGCCNGEEPYSLAMLFLPYVNAPEGLKGGSVRVEIMATDIDKEVLARAEEACYQKSSLREVPDALLKACFHPVGGRLCLNGAVKSLVDLKCHNLMEDPPPEGVDLVLCRYLAFTYYLGERRYGAARKIWEALKPGGALMVGRKDVLGDCEDELFEPWPGAETIFSRIEL